MNMILVGALAAATLLLGFITGLGWARWLDAQKRWWWRVVDPGAVHPSMQVVWTRSDQPPNASWNFAHHVDPETLVGGRRAGGPLASPPIRS